MGDQNGFDAAEWIGSGERLSELFDVDANEATSQVAREITQPLQSDNQYRIQVVPVHTFVLQGHSKDVRLSKGILVPSFASHWGVVIGEPDALTLYHLVFDHDAQVPDEAIPDTIRGKIRTVKFHYMPWENNSNKYGGRISPVGETKFSHEERIKIGFPPFVLSNGTDVFQGKKMIDAFGDYHRVFWNCQTFAKCYLQVICDEEASAKFDAWTASDTSNMVLTTFIPDIRHILKVVSLRVRCGYAVGHDAEKQGNRTHS